MYKKQLTYAHTQVRSASNDESKRKKLVFVFPTLARKIKMYLPPRHTAEATYTPCRASSREITRNDELSLFQA